MPAFRTRSVLAEDKDREHGQTVRGPSWRELKAQCSGHLLCFGSRLERRICWFISFHVLAGVRVASYRQHFSDGHPAKDDVEDEGPSSSGQHGKQDSGCGESFPHITHHRADYRMNQLMGVRQRWKPSGRPGAHVVDDRLIGYQTNK